MDVRTRPLLVLLLLAGSSALAASDTRRATRIDQAAAEASAESHGFYDVRDLLRDESGTWRGIAMQFGRWSRFEIDANGNFTAVTIEEPRQPTPQ